MTTRPDRERVAVTGLGLVTPLGENRETPWARPANTNRRRPNMRGTRATLQRFFPTLPLPTTALGTPRG